MPQTFCRQLLSWYDANQRDLPWRRAETDPWAVLVSEIMLQQTRVETVIPYYEKFLARFPSAADFGAATEDQVLYAWAGLGYYSRARNLQRAAREIAANGFPRTYEAIRALPGVGGYTAAAVASIAFGLPHAALDGNVARVVARLTVYDSDIKTPASRTHLQSVASTLLGADRPGDFNQAMMELGAVICTPRSPKCLLCPVVTFCTARREGREQELPVRGVAPEKIQVKKVIVAIIRGDAILLTRRPDDSRRLAGFWELPEASSVPNIQVGSEIGRFRHSIVNHQYDFAVCSGTLRGRAKGCQWWPLNKLHEIPLSTTAKKAVPCLAVAGSHRKNRET